MKTKKIQIADLKVGDKIKTKSTTGEIIFRLVTDVMHTIVEEENQVRLEFENGIVLNCSINHPIMVLEQHTGVYIEKLPLLLSQTDLVITESGFTRILTADTNQRNNVNYIDITVEDTHTFFASAFEEGQMILTHNSQGGVRNGSATLYCPIWHLEVEDLLVLKNNKGTEDNRIRQMDYGVQFNKVMYERLLSGGNITLFSPSDVPGLYDAFFADTEEFRRLYTQAEANPAVRKKTVKASELFSQFAQERKDTGRIYLQNVDHANRHSPFDPAVAPIKQSNLCLTGDTLIDVQYPTGKQEQIDLQSFVERWELGGMNGVKVKSYDSNTGRIVWCDVSAAAQTGTATEMIEIQDEKGHVVVCTPEHQIYTRNRGYVMAKDLQETDELCVEM